MLSFLGATPFEGCQGLWFIGMATVWMRGGEIEGGRSSCCLTVAFPFFPFQEVGLPRPQHPLPGLPRMAPPQRSWNSLKGGDPLGIP